MLNSKKRQHGRIETRYCKVIECPKALIEKYNWPYLSSIIEIKSFCNTRKLDKQTREIVEIESQETRYYISSLECDATVINKIIRNHWSIENSLHWILDVTFRDDESRIRKLNAPHNMAIIKHVALNLLQRTKNKYDSINGLKKQACIDNDKLLEILSQISSE